LEQKILSTLAASDAINDTWEFAAAENVDHQVLVGVLKSLLSDRYVIDEPIARTLWTLTPEGESIAQSGSPEYQVYEAVPKSGASMAHVQQLLGEKCKIGLGPCMKNKWIKKDGDNLIRINDNVIDETALLLRDLLNNIVVSDEHCKNLKRRKLVNEILRKSYRVTKGPEYRSKRVKKMADLSKDMFGNKNEVNEYLHTIMSCL
jgi:phenylalanyl-tRNA synthetase alpha chain